MKHTLLYLTPILALSSALEAATIAKNIDYTDTWMPSAVNGDSGPVLTASEAGGALSTTSTLLTYDDGNGNSVSFNIELAVHREGVTTGQLEKRDSDRMRFTSDLSGSNDINFDNVATAEQLSFTIKNVTASSGVDTSSIQFKFISLGIQNVGGLAAGDLLFGSTGTTEFGHAETATKVTEQVDLDSSFTNIILGDDSYTAWIHFAEDGTSKKYALSNHIATELQFDLVAAVPEPSTSVLLGVAGMALSIRRKR